MAYKRSYSKNKYKSQKKKAKYILAKRGGIRMS